MLTGVPQASQKSRGVALITAMLIFALVSIVAANLQWNAALDMRRTTVILARDQAIQVALGAESWVMDILKQDLEDSDTDHLGEIWASDLPGLPIDGGEVFGSIVDLQGRFNVNNLIDANGEVHEASLEQFRRLLIVLGIDPRFAGITVDWLDVNQDMGFPDGAEDPSYTTLIPPYKTANQLLTSVSELAAVEGMDKDIFKILEPHITALPGRTAINANTATPAVLQSLDDEVTASDVEGLMTERETSGFGNLQTSFSSIVKPEVLNSLSETSNYFRLKVVVRIGTVRVTLYSTLQRGPQGDVAPILRSIGST